MPWVFHKLNYHFCGRQQTIDGVPGVQKRITNSQEKGKTSSHQSNGPDF
jgi:hypothetical protein